MFVDIVCILLFAPSPLLGLNIFFGSLLSNMLSTVSVMACSEERNGSNRQIKIVRPSRQNILWAKTWSEELVGLSSANES